MLCAQEKKKFVLEFTFSEMLWQPMKGFRVAPGKTARSGAKLLIPQEEVARVMREVGPEPGPTGLRKLAAIKAIVEGWCAAAWPCHQAFSRVSCYKILAGLGMVSELGWVAT